MGNPQPAIEAIMHGLSMPGRRYQMDILDRVHQAAPTHVSTWVICGAAQLQGASTNSNSRACSSRFERSARRRFLRNSLFPSRQNYDSVRVPGAPGGRHELQIARRSPDGRAFFCTEVCGPVCIPGGSIGVTPRRQQSFLSRWARSRFQHRRPTPAKSVRITWVRPELVAEIEFRSWTRDEKLRHASIKGLRYRGISVKIKPRTEK